MNPQDLRGRTKQFALRVIRVCMSLPNNYVAQVLGTQLLKSGTSIGANYREALRASSKRHFVSINEIAIREADETQYWMELIVESGLIEARLLKNLTDECNQLIAILTATVKTAKSSIKSTKRKR